MVMLLFDGKINIIFAFFKTFWVINAYNVQNIAPFNQY